MTSVDWIPILTKILGPQWIEKSHPPEQIVFCMGAILHNVIAEELTIGTAAPFKLYDFYNEVKIQKGNSGGSGLAIGKQIIIEKMKAELRALGFTNEELSKPKPEVIQNILASFCADPIPGFEGFVTPCDLTSPAHRKGIIEFWSLPVEDLGEGIPDPRAQELPDFSQDCEAACIKLWGEPNKRTTKELIWKGGKTFNPSKRVWYDHSAKRGGSTLELVDYHKGRPKRDLRGAVFFEVWREANALGIVPVTLDQVDHIDPPRAIEQKNGPNLAAAAREAVAVYARTGRLLDAALVFGKYNVSIFPCDPETKVPIPRRDPDPTGKYPRGIPGTGGVKKATCDPIIITQWWNRNPHALIAVAMGPLSGVWVCDVDTAVEHKDESVTAWNALVAEHEPFETREHRSASGGPHVIFEWDDEQPLGCSSGALPKGISIKGEGGYVVVPPSVRKGRAYTVHRDINPIIAPKWFVDLITEGKPTPKRDPKNLQPHRPFEGTPQCDLDELAGAMRFVPNNNLPCEEWARWGLAIFAASGGGQRGLEIFDEFSQKSSKYNSEI